MQRSSWTVRAKQTEPITEQLSAIADALRRIASALENHCPLPHEEVQPPSGLAHVEQDAGTDSGAACTDKRCATERREPVSEDGGKQ